MSTLTSQAYKRLKGDIKSPLACKPCLHCTSTSRRTLKTVDAELLQTQWVTRTMERSKEAPNTGRICIHLRLQFFFSIYARCVAHCLERDSIHQ
jgi:hypothetical protein